MESGGKPVLVLGGTGYLGQFLISGLAAQGWKVGFTCNSTQAPHFEGDVEGFWVDLSTGEGLEECFAKLGPLTAVFNCAAISQPVACERDPERTRAVNVPTQLLAALERHRGQHGSEPLLVHLSTDQVYGGSKALWRETDACEPVNAYGRSKLEAEAAIQARWPRHVVLRSSIIYGPLPPTPVNRLLFLQFIDNNLAEKKPTSFFEDEWRSPVYVSDIVRACSELAQRPPAGPRLYNMGGPQRLSRVDMARAVADARGHDAGCILSAPAASVDRGVASPADISMDSSLLEAELGWGLTPFADALRQIYPQQG